MFLSHIQETSTKLKFSTMFFNGAKKQYGYSSHVAITKSLGNILLLGYRDDSTAIFFFCRGLEYSSQHTERFMSLVPEEPEPSSVDAPALTKTHIHVHIPIYIQTYAHTPTKMYMQKLPHMHIFLN